MAILFKQSKLLGSLLADSNFLLVYILWTHFHLTQREFCCLICLIVFLLDTLPFLENVVGTWDDLRSG